MSALELPWLVITASINVEQPVGPSEHAARQGRYTDGHEETHLGLARRLPPTAPISLS